MAPVQRGAGMVDEPATGGPPDSLGTAERREYDWAETTATAAVVETLAAATDSGVTELDPLFEFVDTDALNRIIESSRPHDDGRDTGVSFPVDDHHVTVYADGTVAVRTA